MSKNNRTAYVYVEDLNTGAGKAQIFFGREPYANANNFPVIEVSQSTHHALTVKRLLLCVQSFYPNAYSKDVDFEGLPISLIVNPRDISLNPNRIFRVCYQPKDAGDFRYGRFLISPKQLSKYVGSFNANIALCRALNFKGDKLRIKLRKFGILDFYQK